MNEHLGGAYLECNDANTFMPDNWQYLIDKYAIKSVCDVGTGGGWNARWFLDAGLRVIGVEGWKEALAKNQLPQENLIEHDYANGPLVVPPTDLAWCSEFVEHVEERFIPNYVATFKCCKYLCMTHGEPGQHGHHHVTLKESEWWYKTLLDYGLVVDQEETLYLRSTDHWKAGWGRRTLCWFKNMDFNDAQPSDTSQIQSGSKS